MYSTNTRSEFLSLRLEFVEKRYVLLCALEMDAAVKRLPLLWTKVHFKLYLGACTHTLLQNPFRELLHSFCSCQLQIFWPGSFLHWHEPKLREKMLQKARLLPLHKPDCSFVTCFFYWHYPLIHSHPDHCFSTVTFSHCPKVVVALSSIETNFFPFLQSSYLEFQQSLFSSVEHSTFVQMELYEIPVASKSRKRF